eukprot:CAMPEP_0179944332 /NCGR_PEP_ID=MMETSP0983-20121128/18931_1 /TAXON_ID=483367 /ORGANISM="non described non described, Strain CCMP 2436" /LENGTH=61 /DNA_ID=CAMNT_0021852369 /DNA_START=521 /DNA_END=703 /DNA_ORIENTATION=+
MEAAAAADDVTRRFFSLVVAATDGGVGWGAVQTGSTDQPSAIGSRDTAGAAGDRFGEGTPS